MMYAWYASASVAGYAMTLARMQMFASANVATYAMILARHVAIM